MTDRFDDQQDWLADMPEAAWARAVEFALDPGSTPHDDLVPDTRDGVDTGDDGMFDLDALRAGDADHAAQTDQAYATEGAPTADGVTDHANDQPEVADADQDDPFADSFDHVAEHTSDPGLDDSPLLDDDADWQV
ncbi:hypothetical protein GCM10027418_08740 [Mariniluteicoccus endophyticus]